MNTIKVKPWGEDQGDFVLINEEDFDAGFHSLFDSEKPEAYSEDQPGDDEAKAELAAARADYEAKFGKRPFNGWDANTLREKIAAA